MIKSKFHCRKDDGVPVCRQGNGLRGRERFRVFRTSDFHSSKTEKRLSASTWVDEQPLLNAQSFPVGQVLLLGQGAATVKFLSGDRLQRKDGHLHASDMMTVIRWTAGGKKAVERQ